MATTTRDAPSGTASVRGRNGRGTASWISAPRTMAARYTSGGRTSPRLGTSWSAVIAVQQFEIGLKPSAHSFLVVLPCPTENSLQLSFFPTDEEIDQGNVNRGNDKRRWRSEEQRRSEEDEHVSAEIERIARKTIRAGRDQRFLRFE